MHENGTLSLKPRYTRTLSMTSTAMDPLTALNHLAGCSSVFFQNTYANFLFPQSFWCASLPTLLAPRSLRHPFRGRPSLPSSQRHRKNLRLPIEPRLSWDPNSLLGRVHGRPANRSAIGRRRLQYTSSRGPTGGEPVTVIFFARPTTT